MKPTIKPLSAPINVQITPRLLAAVEASIGRRIPPGCKVMVMPAPKPETTQPQKP